MLCVDCRRPTHYDEADEKYHHDDPEAECWLMGPDAHFDEERRDNIRENLDQLEKRRASQPEAEPPSQPGIEP